MSVSSTSTLEHRHTTASVCRAQDTVGGGADARPLQLPRAYRASYCAPYQPLSRAFSGWIRSPPLPLSSDGEDLRSGGRTVTERCIRRTRWAGALTHALSNFPVLVAVPRVSRSCEDFPDGLDLHPMQGGSTSTSYKGVAPPADTDRACRTQDEVGGGADARALQLPRAQHGRRGECTHSLRTPSFSSYN